MAHRARLPPTVRAWPPTRSRLGLRALRPRRLGPRAGVRPRGHHLPPGQGARHRARRLRPARGAQRLPARHRRRALPGARPRPADHRRRLRAAHRQRPVTARRRVGVLLRRRPADPGQGRLPLRRGRHGRHDRSRQDRPPPHPRGAAAHPLHAQGGDLRRARVGGRRRPQPPRGVRPHARLRGARALQADRRRRGQLRRRLRLRLPRSPGGPEVRPRDLLPRRRVLRRPTRTAWAW